MTAATARGPRVSVCVPAYRAEPFIAETIESVLSQSLPDWELFICDDASQDRTRDLASQYHDPRITILANERNLGIAGNWNKTLRLGSAPFVTLLHSDDKIAPNYLAACLQAFAEHPTAALVHTNIVVTDAAGRSTHGHFAYPQDTTGEVLSPDQAMRRLLHGNFICAPSVMYRRSLLPPGDLFDHRFAYALDYDAWFRLARLGEFVFVGLPLLHYRRHPGRKTVGTSAIVQEREKLDVLLRHTRSAENSEFRRAVARQCLQFARRFRKERPWLALRYALHAARSWSHAPSAALPGRTR